MENLGKNQYLFIIHHSLIIIKIEVWIQNDLQNVEPISPWLFLAICSTPNLYHQTFTSPSLNIIVAVVGEDLVTAMMRDIGTR